MNKKSQITGQGNKNPRSEFTNQALDGFGSILKYSDFTNSKFFFINWIGDINDESSLQSDINP